MPLPSEFRVAKNILSERLLQPRSIPEVHGVGVGKAGPDEYHLRIYVTNLKAPDLRQQLSVALKLNSPMMPSLPSFKLGSGFASQFPGMGWLTDAIVDVIQSPRAIFGATAVTTPTNDPPERTDDDCNYQSPLNPLPAGVSVWWSGSPKKGTISYFCTISGSTTKYLLSCNHVLVPSSNSASLRGTTKILRHGDNGPVEIAKLHEFVELKRVSASQTPQNRVDAAMAAMNAKLNASTTLIVSPRLTGGVKMTAMTLPEYGMIVSKHGYASCWTGGAKIDDILCDFAVLTDTTPQLEFFFVDQFRIIKKNAAGDIIRFAKKGDSGSLIFTVDETVTPKVNRAVGLLFAVGNKFASLGRADTVDHSGDVEYTLATPITTVLTELANKLGSGKTVSLINVPLTPASAA
jgi:hypothetical protein